jgi:poly(A) polymerase
MFDFTQPLAAQALIVVEKLQQAGFVAYLAGGCVRDAMLGRVPKDFDVATDATPDSVREIFGRRRTLAFGASFGVIGVLGNAPIPTEVATFRSDGQYSDGRRPDSIRFGSAHQDALRRDFTINGMFYDPVATKLIDFVGGENDLKSQMIRAIGDPEQRIGEDKLRMLRAVRFASALGFNLHADTQEATRTHAQDVTVVSGERIGAEMRRMLSGPGVARAIELLVDTALVGHIWPTFAANANVDSRFVGDAQRMVRCTTENTFVVTVSMLVSHMIVGQDHAIQEIAARWKLSCDEQRTIDQAIRYRDTILLADQLPWSVVQPIVSSRDATAIIETASGWAQAFEKPQAGIVFCKLRLAWPKPQLDPAPLLTGDTLLKLGYKPGPNFRDVLKAIRDGQLDNRISTEQEAVAQAMQMLGSIDPAQGNC